MIDVLKPQLPLWLHARLLAVLVQCPDSQSEAPGLCWQVQPALKSLYFQDGWSQVYNKTLTSTCPYPPHLKWPVCWSLHFRCQKSLLTPCDLPIAYLTPSNCCIVGWCCGILLFQTSEVHMKPSAAVDLLQNCVSIDAYVAGNTRVVHARLTRAHESTLGGYFFWNKRDGNHYSPLLRHKVSKMGC